MGVEVPVVDGTVQAIMRTTEVLGEQIQHFQPVDASGNTVPSGSAASPVRIDPVGTTAQPITAAALPLPPDAATQTTLAAVLAKLSADPATQTTLAAILAKLTADPATQTTLAAILTKLADPATQTTLAAVLAKLSADPATQTTLAAILAKLTADPATQTTLATIAGLLAGTLTVSGTATVSGTVTADTELPAAAALADATANPTVPTVGSGLLGFNGTTWDRLRSDIANGLDVDVTRLPALVAGSALIGQVNVTPQTANGLNSQSYVSAANNNATSVKGSAGQLYGWIASNKTATPVYLKFYDKATAPSPGSDTPIVVVMLPGNTNGATGQFELVNGRACTNGIAFAIVAGIGATDNTSITANDVVVTVLYK